MVQHSTIQIAHILTIIYREVLQEKLNPAIFFVFNITFISLAQSVLLFLISTPTYVMLLTARFGEGMNIADTVYARVLMGLVLVEFFADQQQWSKFESLKRTIYFAYSPQTTKTQRKSTKRQRKFPTHSIKRI